MDACPFQQLPSSIHENIFISGAYTLSNSSETGQDVENFRARILFNNYLSDIFWKMTSNDRDLEDSSFVVLELDKQIQ